MDRHDKWVKVEPGTVIPAGQPYAVIPGASSPARFTWMEYGEGQPYEHKAQGNYEFFVDSSWCPPLELPTEPTWGIAVTTDQRSDKSGVLGVGHRWWLDGDKLQGDLCCWAVAQVLDFIPLTDEQVARIEAAR